MMINCSSLAVSGSISSATCGNSWSCRPIQPPTYRTVSSPMVTPSPPRGHELKSLYRTGKSFSPPFLKQGTHTTIYGALSFVPSRHLFCNWLMRDTGRVGPALPQPECDRQNPACRLRAFFDAKGGE